MISMLLKKSGTKLLESRERKGAKFNIYFKTEPEDSAVVVS
jgi:hypothetical protein